MMVAGNIPGLTQTASLAIYDAVQAGDPGGPAGSLSGSRASPSPRSGWCSAPSRREGLTLSTARSILDVRLIRRIHADLSVDVTLRLGTEIGVLFGPSGSGKTSILRLITGLSLTRPGIRPARGNHPLRRDAESTNRCAGDGSA